MLWVLLLVLGHATVAVCRAMKTQCAAPSIQGPFISEDETESRGEVEDYIDDLGESPMSIHGLQVEDPDYVPCNVDVHQTRRDRSERRITRGESKGKKKKLGWCTYVYFDTINLLYLHITLVHSASTICDVSMY